MLKVSSLSVYKINIHRLKVRNFAHDLGCPKFPTDNLLCVQIWTQFFRWLYLSYPIGRISAIKYPGFRDKTNCGDKET